MKNFLKIGLIGLILSLIALPLVFLLSESNIYIYPLSTSIVLVPVAIYYLWKEGGKK